MNKRLHCIVFYLVLIASFNLSYTQVKTEKQPLAQILLAIEKQYDVKFSYETTNIKNITIAPLYPELSLKQVLIHLREITLLNFKVLSKRFIAITQKEKSELEKTVQRLEEVVVTKYLTKGISKTNNGTVTAKTKTFDILPGLIEPDILQIIQNLPGIISVDERISNINVRGGTNDQNLILYEGIRMYQSGHFFGLISAFNPYLSEEVNISKNGTSARFGNGVSSTISIKNYDNLGQKNKVGLGGNLLSVDGYAKVPLTEKTELQLSARRSFTDLVPSVTYDTYFDRIFRDSELNISNDINTLLSLDERFLFYDFNGKFIYNIDQSSKLKVNVLNIYNNLDYNQIFTTSDNSFQETRSDLNQLSFGGSINYSKLFNNGIRASSEVYYSNYKLNAKNNDITNAQVLSQENEVNDYGLRLDASKSIYKRLSINAGYQFNEVGVTNFENITSPIFTSFIKEIIRTHAFYSEAEWYSKSRKSYMRLGIRGSYFEKLSEFLVEPRFTFNQKFLKHFRLEILGELKSQSVTQIIDLQQDFFGIEKRRWQLSNGNDVPLIKSQQVSMGLSYNRSQLLISAEAYYKNVDQITSRSQGFQNQFQFTNSIGSYGLYGLDVLINKQFKNFSTWLSYTYSNNRYKFQDLNNGNLFPNTLDLRHVANASITYNIADLRISAGLNWHSGRPYTAPKSFQDESNSTIEYNSPNSSRLSDYFRSDISAIYNFSLHKGIKAEIGASIWNIFDRTNIINRNYIFNTENAVVEINNRSLKRTPNLSFRLSF